MTMPMLLLLLCLTSLALASAACDGNERSKIVCYVTDCPSVGRM